jgi:predicted phosphoribosyltransferase
VNIEKNNVIIDLPELRNRVRVFRDRHHAGIVLAGMLKTFRDGSALVLGIPSGGIPIAVVIAQELNLDLDVAVANKITPPWSSEIGYGAIAFDGTYIINQAFIEADGLSEQQVLEGKEIANTKVKRRSQLLRGDRPFPKCTGRPVIVVDDGIATGVTLQAVVNALRKAGAKHLIVAVPTSHDQPLMGFAQQVEEIYCPNIRREQTFAVAEAYENWRDLDELSTANILKEFYNSVKNKGSES